MSNNTRPLPSVAEQVIAVELAIALVVLVIIAGYLHGIREEAQRGRARECIVMDYQGVDSLGPQDREACP